MSGGREAERAGTDCVKTLQQIVCSPQRRPCPDTLAAGSHHHRSSLCLLLALPVEHIPLLILALMRKMKQFMACTRMMQGLLIIWSIHQGSCYH